MERWAIEVRDLRGKWDRVFAGEADDATVGRLARVHTAQGHRVRVERLAEPEPGDLVWVRSGPAQGALLTFVRRPQSGLMGAMVIWHATETWVPSVALHRRAGEDAAAARVRARVVHGVDDAALP